MNLNSFQKCILTVVFSIFSIVAFYSIRLNSTNLIKEDKKQEIFVAIPDSANYQGFFYTENGEFLGKIGSSENIFITNTNTYQAISQQDSIDVRKIYSLTDIAHISHTDFLNRINWTYGEGGGMAADYYASTINNLSHKMGEHNMYTMMNEGQKGSADDHMKSYFVDYNGPNKNYKRFKNYRSYILNGEKLSGGARKNLTYFQHATKGNIRVLSGRLEDPTAGAINKIGGIKSIDYALRHNVSGKKIIVVKSINKESKYTSYHVFFELGKKRTSADTQYTLITMEDFRVVDEKTVVNDITA